MRREYGYAIITREDGTHAIMVRRKSWLLMRWTSWSYACEAASKEPAHKKILNHMRHGMYTPAFEVVV